MSTASKQNMAITADLMVRGATLLREPCPRCGAVQIKFNGRTFCTAEDDLSTALSSGEDSKKSPKNEDRQSSETKSETPNRVVNLGAKAGDLRAILEGKLADASKQLESTTNLEEQGRLLDLISKYVETLAKLEK